MKNMTLRSQQERGALPLGAIIGVAIVGAIIFVAIQLIPIYWNQWDFQSKAEESVTFVFIRYPRDQQEKLRNEIVGVLDEIGAVYEEDDIVVKVDGKKKRASVEVSYSRPHKVPFIENPLRFYVNVSTE
jgi:hypothetical protein